MKDAIIYINNVIPITNLSLKLYMHFIYLLPVKFKYTFAVAWQIPKENSSFCVINFRVV